MVLSVHLFNMNIFLPKDVSFMDAQLTFLKHLSEAVLGKVFDFMDSGYPFRFAFYLGVYYGMYHENDGAHRADDVDLDVYFFIREHSKDYLGDCKPYFLFLYEKDPTLRAYFRSQEIFNLQFRFITEDPDDDGM